MENALYTTYTVRAFSTPRGQGEKSVAAQAAAAHNFFLSLPGAKIIKKVYKNLMLEHTKSRIFELALSQFGIRNQTDMLIEEMAELTQALLHDRRGRAANIPEEIADVTIMLEQIIQFYGISADVDLQKQKKLCRLAERVGLKGWLNNAT